MPSCTPSPPGTKRPCNGGCTNWWRRSSCTSGGAAAGHHYTFKHALIQDVAYQSLLRSTRQQYHQRMAQVLEARFPEIVETQPELVAHHYTEAGLSELAITYWQQAGERAVQHSAYVEAIGHFTKGLEVLKAIETPERARRELHLRDRPVPGIGGHPGPCSTGDRSRHTHGHKSCVGRWGRLPSSFPCCGDSGGFITTVGSTTGRVRWENSF